MLARRIDGDFVLYDQRSGSVHRLNSVAALIWHLCDGARDAAAITSQVAALFGQQPGDVAPHIDDILARFTDHALIE
jgi:PqqD family protein of HPr-rel-A system